MTGDTGHGTRLDLEREQWRKIRALLAAVIPANPFYAHKLKAIDQSSRLAGLDDFFSRVPFTTKSELSADHVAHPPYGSNLTFPLERYTRCHQTSGSSGQPMRWLDTNESWASLLDNWSEIYRAARVSAPDHLFSRFPSALSWDSGPHLKRRYASGVCAFQAAE